MGTLMSNTIAKAIHPSALKTTSSVQQEQQQSSKLKARTSSNSTWRPTGAASSRQGLGMLSQIALLTSVILGYKGSLGRRAESVLESMSGMQSQSGLLPFPYRKLLRSSILAMHTDVQRKSVTTPDCCSPS